MNTDKAVHLFKLCVRAELDFKQAQRPSLVRRAIRKQHQLYCVITKDTWDQKEFKVGRMERFCYELIKSVLIKRLDITFDDIERVLLSRTRKKVAVNDSNR